VTQKCTVSKTRKTSKFGLVASSAKGIAFKSLKARLPTRAENTEKRPHFCPEKRSFLGLKVPNRPLGEASQKCLVLGSSAKRGVLRITCFARGLFLVTVNL